MADESASHPVPHTSDTTMHIQQEILKVAMLSLFTYLDWMPIFEWRVVWCGCKNGYQKDVSSKNMGLCAENMIATLDSTIDATYAFIKQLQ